MIFATFIHLIKSRLTVKLVLIFVLFFSVVSLLLSSFFMVYNKTLLENELRKRTYSLAENLADNSSNYLYSDDNSIVNSFISGVKRDPDMAHVFLTDLHGEILLSSDTQRIGKDIILPAGIDFSGARRNWLQSDTPSLRRIITPVERAVPIIDAQNPLIASSKEGIPAWDEAFRGITYYFPNFTPHSDEVTFSASIIFALNTASIMSVSLRDHSLRLLVKGGSNGVWSDDGRYLAYNRIQKVSDVAVISRETGTEKKICSDEQRIYGVPCFTRDNRYIITTLASPDGHEKLFRIPRDGGKPEQITFHEGSHWYPNCSPDGKWILYTELKSNQLYVYDTETHHSRPVFPGLNDPHRGGHFSPDGNQISYLRFLNETNAFEVFIADFPFRRNFTPSDNSFGRQITFTREIKYFNTDWSPDGEWIAFAQRGLTNLYNVWIVPAQGGKPINLTGALESRRKTIGYAVLDVSTKNLNRAIENGKRIALLISLLFIGIGALGAMFLVRSMVRPVKMVGDAAGAIAQGDLNQKVLTNRSDEIGALTESFNLMAGQLTLSRTEIEAGTRELEKKHRELEQAYKELNSLDKAKDDFLSLVSHELRTPLSSLLVFSEMLLKGAVGSEETKKEIHKTMVEECRRLSRLINDVLDLAKIEAGSMNFNIQTVNIKELVRDTLSRMNPIISRKRIHVDHTNIHGNILLRGDRDKIIQVLENIISNAVKFTPEDKAIFISFIPGDGMGCIAVQDSGKGIKQEDIPKVFNRFTQLESIEHHSEGSGLGMTISKSMIENMGGDIWIESALGRGTTVFFSLPLAAIESWRDEHSYVADTPIELAPANQVHENGPVGILIVDDDPSLRLALSECIREAGYAALMASNGLEALDLLKSHTPSLVILDVMLPGVSGLEVCRNIRENHAAKEMKVIMLSALGMEKDKEEGLQAGADRYITKPFSYEELEGAIKELLAVT